MLVRLGLLVAVVCLAVTAEEAKRLLIDTVPLNMCPIVDCFYPTHCLGQPTHTSHINIGGRLCPGCPSCTITDLLQGHVAKRERQTRRPLCPNIQCLDVACPRSTRMLSHYVTFNGQLCPTCPVCRNMDIKRSTQPVLDFYFLHCPIYECAYPGPCPEGYKHSFFMRNGHNCTGCPYCPNNHLLIDRLPLV